MTSLERLPIALSVPVSEDTDTYFGRAISTFVERAQENLAIFSIPDDALGMYLQPEQTSLQYDPKFLIFEFLLNDRRANAALPDRQFELHVSDKLLADSQKVTDDLKRLYINAERLGVDWQQVEWDTPMALARGLSGLTEDMQQLNQLHCYSLNGILPEAEVAEVARILQKLIKRWEAEYIPTNFSANALIYEAWKFGKFLPLSCFNPSNEIHQKLLDGLFIAHTRERTTSLLEQMPANLGLDVRTLEYDRLSNRKIWTRTLYPDSYPASGQKWFPCVEHSLIHKALVHEEKSTNRYLIHYPLIIDDYWFAGLAYVYTEWDDSHFSQTPELFDRRKYLKFYKVIQSIADVHRFARRNQARRRASTLIRQGKTLTEAFREAVQDYFVCLHVLAEDDSPEANNISIRSQSVYANHGITIYGPQWMNAQHQKSLAQELDGRREMVGMDILGLYEEIVRVNQRLQTIQLEGRIEGKDEQSRQVAHQAAGLVAEIWCDPAKSQLTAQTQGCLWHLKSLIDIWGNFDLTPTESISSGVDACFPEWSDLNEAEILQGLINISLSHALRRATYRRVQRTALDERVRSQAFQILSAADPIAQFTQAIGIGYNTETLPHWVRYKGFAVCFHHCFWPAAYHAFRAACAQYDYRLDPHCLKITTTSERFQIANRIAPESESSQATRDRGFYQILQTRVGNAFQIDSPELVRQGQMDWFDITISLGS
jgi:hypothetical protein